MENGSPVVQGTSCNRTPRRAGWINLCHLEKQFSYDGVQQSGPVLFKSETEFKEVNSVFFNSGFSSRATLCQSS